eukprot:gb/GECG01000811.1/.p1 GENE.gb/GECG01000811.1/~~gb/GECG01000811.1/.p1  ORF type:complete len:1568 (+),score=224.54 gb/GECG01000811.1/:1-4704(+)
MEQHNAIFPPSPVIAGGSATATASTGVFTWSTGDKRSNSPVPSTPTKQTPPSPLTGVVPGSSNGSFEEAIENLEQQPATFNAFMTQKLRRRIRDQKYRSQSSGDTLEGDTKLAVTSPQRTKSMSLGKAPSHDSCNDEEESPLLDNISMKKDDKQHSKGNNKLHSKSHFHISAALTQQQEKEGEETRSPSCQNESQRSKQRPHSALLSSSTSYRTRTYVSRHLSYRQSRNKTSTNSFESLQSGNEESSETNDHSARQSSTMRKIMSWSQIPFASSPQPYNRSREDSHGSNSKKQEAHSPSSGTPRSGTLRRSESARSKYLAVPRKSFLDGFENGFWPLRSKPDSNGEFKESSDEQHPHTPVVPDIDRCEEYSGDVTRKTNQRLRLRSHGNGSTDNEAAAFSPMVYGGTTDSASHNNNSGNDEESEDSSESSDVAPLQHNFEKRIPPQHTGTILRRKALNSVRFDTVNPRDAEPEPMHSAKINKAAFQRRFPRDGAAPRKVVYAYSDSFNFSRVLAPTDVVFDSHFEAGNLRKAMRVQRKDNAPCAQEYELHMHNDVHSRGHRQWFFFSVSNVQPGVPYVFHITNFSKPDSMYNYGMLPLAYSVGESERDGRGWYRCGYTMGDNEGSTSGDGETTDSTPSDRKSRFRYVDSDCEQICYYKVPADADSSERFYVLTFTHTFKYRHDLCYFAMCYPYTYTDLCRILRQIVNTPSLKPLVTKERLCETMAGNKCEMLTIAEEGEDLRRPSKRQVIVLSARVHPGESNASWVMEGVIRQLLSDHGCAKWLRRHYTIRIIPMLNVDGVINGNYRTSLAGADLNRRWKYPHRVLHPTIYNLKTMMETLNNTVGVALYCDFHGHSRQQGIFFYSCPGSATKGNGQWGCTSANPSTREESGSSSSVVDPKNPLSMISSLCDATVDMFGSKMKVKMSMEANRHHSGPPQWTDPLISRRDPGWMCWPKGELDRLIKVVPAVLSDNTSSFSFDKCRFKLTKDKTGTARSVVFRELQIPLAYTCEASFCGSNGFHFNETDYMIAGGDFVKAMYTLLLNKKLCEGQATRALSAITAQRMSVIDTIVRHLSISTLLYHSDSLMGEVFRRDQSGDQSALPQGDSADPLLSPERTISFRDTLSPSSKSRYEQESFKATKKADDKSSKKWAKLFGLTSGTDCSWRDSNDKPETLTPSDADFSTYYGAIKWIGEESETMQLLDGNATINLDLQKSPPIDFSRTDHSLGKACQHVLSIQDTVEQTTVEEDEERKSDASDDCPSDDNLEISELVKLLRESGLKDAAAEIMSRGEDSNDKDQRCQTAPSSTADRQRKKKKIVREKPYQAKGLSDASALMAPMHRLKALSMLNEKKSENGNEGEKRDNQKQPQWVRKPPVVPLRKHTTKKKKKRAAKDQASNSSIDEDVDDQYSSTGEQSDDRESAVTPRVSSAATDADNSLPVIANSGQREPEAKERIQGGEAEQRSVTTLPNVGTDRTEPLSSRTASAASEYSPWEGDGEPATSRVEIEFNGDNESIGLCPTSSRSNKPPKPSSAKRASSSGSNRNGSGVLLRSRSAQPRQLSAWKKNS